MRRLRRRIARRGPPGSPVHLGHIGRGRRQAGADGPHGLIGDDRGRRPWRLRASSPPPAPARWQASCRALRWSMVSPTQTMATRPARCAASALARTIGVRLAVVGAALGMADDDGRRAGVAQHLGRDVARVGAARLGVAILAADGDRRPRHGRCQPLHQRRRRRDQHVAAGCGSLASSPASFVASASDAASAVHLPVAGHQRADRCHQSPWR